MFILTNKPALVAGGAGYLGVPVCKAIAKQGAAVMVADISADRVASAVACLLYTSPSPRD